MTPVAKVIIKVHFLWRKSERKKNTKIIEQLYTEKKKKTLESWESPTTTKQ